MGHADVVRRAGELFERLVVAVAVGQHKRALFSLIERVEMAQDAFRGYAGVTVEPFEGLLRDFVVAHGAKVVIRGLRASTDYDYEFQLAAMNRRLMPHMETVFLMSDESRQHLSSTYVREVAMLGGDVLQFVSPYVGVRLRVRIAESLRRLPVLSVVLCPPHGPRRRVEATPAGRAFVRSGR